MARWCQGLPNGFGEPPCDNQEATWCDCGCDLWLCTGCNAEWVATKREAKGNALVESLADVKNITNEMVAAFALFRGLDPEKATGGDIDTVYEDLREAIGNPCPDAPMKARTVGRLSDERQDKINELMKERRHG